MDENKDINQGLVDEEKGSAGTGEKTYTVEEVNKLLQAEADRRVSSALAKQKKEYEKKLTAFDYNGIRLTNFEMESAMLQGLAKLMGHKAVTVCSIIAGRVSHTSNPNYKGSMQELVKLVIDKL